MEKRKLWDRLTAGAPEHHGPISYAVVELSLLAAIVVGAGLMAGPETPGGAALVAIAGNAVVSGIIAYYHRKTRRCLPGCEEHRGFGKEKPAIAFWFASFVSKWLMVSVVLLAFGHAIVAAALFFGVCGFVFGDLMLRDRYGGNCGIWGIIRGFNDRFYPNGSGWSYGRWASAFGQGPDFIIRDVGIRRRARALFETGWKIAVRGLIATTKVILTDPHGSRLVLDRKHFKRLQPKHAELMKARNFADYLHDLWRHQESSAEAKRRAEAWAAEAPEIARIIALLPKGKFRLARKALGEMFEARVPSSTVRAVLLRWAEESEAEKHSGRDAE